MQIWKNIDYILPFLPWKYSSVIFQLTFTTSALHSNYSKHPTHSCLLLLPSATCTCSACTRTRQKENASRGRVGKQHDLHMKSF